MPPIQVYECPIHGERDYAFRWEDEIPEARQCGSHLKRRREPCGRLSRHVLKAPAGVKIVRDWNEKANDWQRDPYTQARAQTENAYNAAKDRGQDVAKPTEAGIQVAAAAISKEKKGSPRPGLERRHVAAARRASRKKSRENT